MIAPQRRNEEITGIAIKLQGFDIQVLATVAENRVFGTKVVLVENLAIPERAFVNSFLRYCVQFSVNKVRFIDMTRKEAFLT